MAFIVCVLKYWLKGLTALHGKPESITNGNWLETDQMAGIEYAKKALPMLCDRAMSVASFGFVDGDAGSPFTAPRPSYHLRQARSMC